MYKDRSGDDKVPTKSQKCYQVAYYGSNADYLDHLYIITDIKIGDDYMKALSKLSIIAFNMAYLSGNSSYMHMYDLLNKINGSNIYSIVEIPYTTTCICECNECDYENLNGVARHEFIDNCNESCMSCEAFDTIFNNICCDSNIDTKLNIIELYSSLDRLIMTGCEVEYDSSEFKGNLIHIGPNRQMLHLYGTEDYVPRLHVTFEDKK